MVGESRGKALNFFGIKERSRGALAGQVSAADMEKTGLKRGSRKSHKPAQEKLRTAAELFLRQEGRSVIDRLAESSLDGDVQSTKLLFEIAHGSDAGDEFHSLALELDDEWARHFRHAERRALTCRHNGLGKTPCSKHARGSKVGSDAIWLAVRGRESDERFADWS